MTMSRHPVLLKVVLVLLMALLSVGATGTGVEVGADAPKFESKDVDGAPVRLEDLRGRVVVLNFWASWCTPCLTELPLLDALHGRLAAETAMVLAVNVDTQRGPALGAIRKLKLSLPVALDPKGAVVAQFGPPGLPATYVIGPDGTLRSVRTGEIDGAGIVELEAEILALVDGVAP